MPRAHAALVLLPLLGLAACQGAPDAVATGQQQSRECAERMERDPRYAALAPHLPLGGGAASAAQRADRGIPGAAQRAALRAWKEDLGLCRRPTLAAVGVFAPNAVPALRRNFARSDAVLDKLVLGRSTWAAANRARDAIGESSVLLLWPETPRGVREASLPAEVPSRPASASREPVPLAPSPRG